MTLSPERPVSDPECYLADLDPLFAAECRKVLAACQDAGRQHPSKFQLRPFFGRRSVHAQARLYRQSRGWPDIERSIGRLRDLGAPFLASVLEEVGPQNGRWATNALPGQSWHQWGKALDSFVLVEGVAVWNSGHAGYRIYAEEAERLGLTAGANWANSPDAVHIQHPAQSVTDTMSWAEIDDAMRAQYGSATRGA